MTATDATLARACAALAARYPQNGRLLLVQLPQIVLDAFNRDVALANSYYIFPPTGLQYIYEAIRHRGLEVRILDLNYRVLKAVHEDPDFDVARWPEILRAEMDDFRPAMVGVSCLFDFAIGPMLKTLKLLRARDDALVVMGGVVATYEYANLLEHDLAHVVIDGEGETRFNRLLDHLLDDTGTPPVGGIHFRDGEALAESEGPAHLEALGGDLVASYDLVAVEEYCRYGSLNPYSRMDHVPKAPFAAIQLSRGCRAACTFCSVRDFMGKGVRMRPVADVLAEMRFLIETRGVRHFEWLDDDLLFHREPVKELLRAIIDQGWDIRWSANNGLIAASIDAETIALMRDSGCIGFKIGIESGNPDMLRKVRKPGNHAKFRRMAELAAGEAPNIFIGGNFIVGLPEERVHQMMDSFKFALEIQLDWAAVTQCQMIRGASAFADAGEYFDSQIRSEGRTVKNFIPSRHSVGGHVETGAVAHGLDIFDLPPDEVPGEDQVKEIWFAFNLLLNYVFNKNLSPGGRPDKFISWVEPVLMAYSSNPYMNLFLALAYVLKGETAHATQFHAAAVRHSADPYWQDRFREFGLDDLLSDLPADPQSAHAAIDHLRTRLRPRFAAWLAAEYGEVPDAASVVI